MSTSFPYLALARRMRMRYGDVLRIVEHLDMFCRNGGYAATKLTIWAIKAAVDDRRIRIPGMTDYARDKRMLEILHAYQFEHERRVSAP